jgi:hypothetical protein
MLWAAISTKISPRTGLGAARGRARHSVRAGVANQNALVGNSGGQRTARPTRDRAGTPPRPGWFFLDKIFRGRKVKSVKQKTMIVKCSCQNCDGHLEFDSEGAGLTIDCPHCGMKTQLYFPQTARSLSRKKAGFYLGIIILAAIAFATYRFYILRADRFEKQNEIAAIATKKASEESKKTEQEKEKALRQYLIDTNCPGAARFIETVVPGILGSTKKSRYSISYINADCLLIQRAVSVQPGERIVNGFQALKDGYLDNKNDKAQDQYGNSNESDAEKEQSRFDRYANREEAASTHFLILRKDLNDVNMWIEKYKKDTQVAEAEHLASHVTNNISRCVSQETYYWGSKQNIIRSIEGHSNPYGITPLSDYPSVIFWEDVQFITPHYLQIGTSIWDYDEVTKLEKVVSMIPNLDADLKANIATAMAKRNNDANQNQLRLNEENRAKALLK